MATDQSFETPLTYQGHAVLTLRQIDRLNQVAKGTAFRAFKRVEAQLSEGEDFFVFELNAGNATDVAGLGPAAMPEGLWEALQSADALYPSSQVVILLTQKAYSQLQRADNLSSL